MGNLQYVLLCLMAIVACTFAEELYSDQYDHIDATEVMKNDQLREQYYACFMDKGPCATPDAVYFRERLPEAFATKCKKCTDKQKQNFSIIADWYAENRPSEWNDIVQKFLEEAKKLNIEIE